MAESRLESQFVYVTYIRTTKEKLWRALLEPEFTRQYWMGVWQESEWKPGASWKMILPDGRVADSGQVIEIEPMKKLVLKWQNQFRPELKEEGASTMTYELEPIAEMVKLTIVHTMPRQDSKFIQAVSGGWPKIMASLKSLLETGEALSEMKQLPKEMQCEAQKSLVNER